MKVLVTGAGGYLGRRVVLALRRRGHQVRALDLPRPGPRAEERGTEGVEEFRADLCASPDLARVCEGVQAVIHLAAKMVGDHESLVKTAVEGTRRLLDAMEEAGVRRMVLASSLSVYDWAAAEGVLDEDSPLEQRPEVRDAYTIAKLRQEQTARDRCGRSGIALTVLRPGTIWGTGREYPSTIGPHAGPFHFLIAAARELPVVHVENCADAFAAVIDAGPVAEGTFNLIDHPGITARRFVRDHLRRFRRFGIVIPVAYQLGLASVGVLHRLTPRSLQRRLPSFVAPARFAARYRPARIDGARFRNVVGWQPPLSYERCLDGTYGGPSRASPRARSGSPKV